MRRVRYSVAMSGSAGILPASEREARIFYGNSYFNFFIDP
jgi:hypothetical protein